MGMMTKSEAIAAHRRLWNWIADKTIERKRIVRKTEYFAENNILNYPLNCCYCCDFANNSYQENYCCDCPLDWQSEVEVMPCENLKKMNDDGGLYSQWCRECGSGEWKEAARIAREIANLPEKEFA